MEELVPILIQAILECLPEILMLIVEACAALWGFIVMGWLFKGGSDDRRSGE